jgi:hypothetical protein
MPIVPEIFYTPNTINIYGQNNATQGILTDYIPDLSLPPQAGVAGSQFIYNASSLWRVFQFCSNSPLRNITVSIYFTDKNNYKWPLSLFLKQSCEIKFMFIKKYLYKKLS